ncbi:MAG: HEAT repeat domain-containing protein [bacterium]
MKRTNLKPTFRTIFLLQATLGVIFLAGTGTAQEEIHVPDYFNKFGDGSKSLPERITRAQAHFKQTYPGNRFWIGYQFEPREDIEFDDIYIYDDGGITISRGGGHRFHLREDDDLDTHILHALSELGVEKAREALEKIKHEITNYSARNLGLFFLIDARNLNVLRVKLLYLHNKKKFEAYPVYWFGKIGNHESFAYLSKIVSHKNYPANVIKPAIFVLSLHKHPGIISFLTQTAKSDQYLEIRKSAVFWLGQIPGEESLQALVELFDQETNREMKEKMVFAISQHKSEKVMNRLTEIAKTDRDFEVREKAIFWLGQIDQEESLDILQEIMKNAHSNQIKEKCVFAISQHKSEKSASILIDLARNDKNYDVRKKAIFWLGQMAGKKTLAALSDIVETDEETDLKTKAVFAISQHSDKATAINMLMDIAKHNSNPEVRKKAIFWLGQSGDERAIDFFKEILIK